jgi:hypothetical protein
VPKLVSETHYVRPTYCRLKRKQVFIHKIIFKDIATKIPSPSMSNRDDRPIEEQLEIIEEALQSLTLRVTRLRAEASAAAISARPPEAVWTPRVGDAVRIWIGTVQHEGEIEAVLPRHTRVRVPDVVTFVSAPHNVWHL